MRESERPFDVAVIGLAGRWPGVSTVAELWAALAGGVDAIRPFDDEELRARGVEESRLRDPQFVKAGAVLSDADRFAAAFFGYSPREAALLDPQHRVFLECAWEALEDAGYAPRHAGSHVGVFASCGLSTYLLFNIVRNAGVDEKDEAFQAMIGTDKDFLATRVSYKLNLTGPSVTVQTGCSSSLVAVCLAVQNLLTYQCDMALAGGVAVQVPHRTGYWHQPGGITSPDGRCRPFAANAAGTVFGDGAGVVVLKRVADAIADHDRIDAVIRGAAINNDGSAKLGYTAPSVSGQADVIRRALAIANVAPETISYVEAHGTATALGDPAEMLALTQVLGTDRRQRCAIGSVKGNVGHLDAAAGITGLIKTVLMLRHGAIVPSLHCETPNPRIDFANGRFYVSTSLRPWTVENEGLRRAGVSSFGIGGTNAHVVLEAAPAGEARGPRRPVQLLTLSADSPRALDAMTGRLVRHLDVDPASPLADVAFTLHVGREPFRYRRIVTADSVGTAASRLRTLDREHVFDADAGGSARPVVLMFPGGAAQYPGMGQELYRTEPIFAQAIEECATRLTPAIGMDLRHVLYPSPDRLDEATRALETLSMSLPAIFATSYAMTRLLASWGVQPQAMIGHSLGEYVAACVAGVLSLGDALDVVLLRGRLIDSLPPGAMLGVYLSPPALAEHRLADVEVAAVNGPETCVIAGSPEAIATAAARLERRGVECRPLHINAAAHSRAVEPIVDTLRDRLQTMRLSSPSIPYISNLTGTWITAAQAIDPRYWARHLREPVQFSAGIGELAAQPDRVFVEVGPGRSLSSFVRGQLTGQTAQRVIPLMKHAREPRADAETLADGVGRLWLSGVGIDWRQYHQVEDCRRVSLPTYPFERARYWIDRPAPEASHRVASTPGTDDATFYVPAWTRTQPPRAAVLTGEDLTVTWLLLFDADDVVTGLANDLRMRIERAGGRVVMIDPSSAGDVRAVLRAARRDAGSVRVVHLWTLAAAAVSREAQRLGLFSLLALGQAIAQESIAADILIVTNAVEQVRGRDRVVPERSTLHAACLVLPQELEGVRCRLVDIGDAPDADAVLAECTWEAAEPIVAWRDGQRWSPHYESRVLTAASDGQADANADTGGVREDGVYLLIGGTGEIGLTLARAWTARTRCRIALTGRRGGARRSEGLGSNVAVYAANAADLPRMRAVVDDIERRWGPLTGIIHLAGVTGASALAAVADLSAGDFEAHFEPKVDGVSVLQQIAHGRRLDFCVTFSSTASILGGVGMLPYAAANAFLDSVAVAAPAAPRWISINWDGWLTSDTTPLQGTALARYALAPDRAVRLFAQILASTISGQVVVSTAPLQPRIEEWTTAARPRSAARPELIADYVAPRTPLETEVAGVWARVLGLGRVGVHDNLFELGGNSLIALRLVSQLTRVTGVTVPATVIFEAPTVRTLAAWIQAQRAPVPTAAPVPASAPVHDPPMQAVVREEAEGIAIIGMAGRFPGADSVADFWQRLVRGEDCIQRQAGGGETPDFVRATAALSDYQCFDAAFFGMPPSEAMLRDPQHRILLEQAWAALEDAGYDCRRSPHRVGVFAGATTNTYLTHHIARRPDVMAAFDPVQINVANGADFLTTLLSYKLNLTGPSHTVQSACSTSLVAVHTACRSLIDGECDMALAGGVSVNLAIADGYRHVAGGILSADGFVRAFDAQATGTVFGSGVGVVVLKRLADARRDGDSIRAIIRGSAVNNDGALKAGYTTPSVDGEARVIEEALRAARVDPQTVSYIECHGTGTTLGDPIELRALAKAYRSHPCAIGSVKTNVGHLDAAAGVAGLIKVVESLRHGTLVPSLHYQSPNPQIDLASTPCLVNTTRREWPRGDGPRRAGVSAFGVGGTNAHVIVEEAPAQQTSGPGRPWQLLVWSARTMEALDTIAQRLASHLRQHTELALADAAYTLQVGRHRLPWRRAIVCRERQDALDALEAGLVDARRDASTDDAGPVLFLIPADDALRPGTGRELYASERIYREQIDRAAAVLEAKYGLDVKDVLVEADRMTGDGGFAPAAQVATAYALAKLWESWGVRPAALLGHGVGEYAVAALSGVLTLEQALWLAAGRGRVLEAGGDEAAFVDTLSQVTWGAIGVPYVSSVTGTWITEVDVRSTEYWRRHLRGHLQDGRALDTLRGDGAGVVLEIAPSDMRARLQTLAGLWAAGVDIDWRGFAADERRHRVPLPSYPFQRTRHWIDPPKLAAPEPPAPARVAITSNRPALRNPYVAPRGQLEESIAGIVEASLGIHPIGVTDRFGELGGDSLQAVRIIDAINTRLGCHLRAIDLYEEATVRALVQRLAPEEPPVPVPHADDSRHPEGARYESDRSGDRVGERAQGVSE